MSHVAAGLAFEAESLFFGGFGEFLLQRETLSTVAFFFAFVVAFTFCHGSSLSSLVQGDCVCFVSFTFWAVRSYFFGNVHVYSLPDSIMKTSTLLYFFRF